MHRIQIQDPPDQGQVEQAAAALRRGELIVLPTETVYGLAALADAPGAAASLAAAKGRPGEQRFTHHLAAAGDLDALAAPLPDRLRRFLDRFWPGPLTIIVPAKGGRGEVGARVPAHPFTTAVLRAAGSSVFMTSVNQTGSPPINDPGAIVAALGGNRAITLLADAGTPRLGEPSAVVEFHDGILRVVRHGLLSEEELLAGAAAKVLFVCTGNTCRSPLAELLARQGVAAHLGIDASEVLAHGLQFQSAGTATADGMPASDGSLAAAADAGLSLAAHVSQPLTPDLVARMDRIYCLSTSHFGRVLELDPTAAGKTSLLHPDGDSVSDPYGGPVEIYRVTRDEIAEYLRIRLPEILALRDGALPRPR